MNVNFGLFPPMPEVQRSQRKQAMARRALVDIDAWLGHAREAAA